MISQKALSWAIWTCLAIGQSKQIMLSLIKNAGFAQAKSAHPARAGDGEARPWESTKDNKIESTEKAIDKLVYELSPKGDNNMS